MCLKFNVTCGQFKLVIVYLHYKNLCEGELEQADQVVDIIISIK